MGRVMVVDDEADMRGVLSLFLKRSGHQVEEASSGEEMLAKLNTYKPDLVLLDMRMAGIDGLRTLQKIREMDKKLPVIMVSGYGGKDFAGQAVQKGATLFISKPFKNEELFNAMIKVGVMPSTAPAADEPPVVPSLVRHRSGDFIPASKAAARPAGGSAHLLKSIHDFWDALKQMTLHGVDRLLSRFGMSAEFSNGSSRQPNRLDQLEHDMKKNVERIHFDLSSQMQTLTQSIQSEIDRLSSRVGKSVEPAVASALPDSTREQLRADMRQTVEGIQKSMNERLDQLARTMQAQLRSLSEQKETLPQSVQSQRAEWDRLLSSVRSTLEDGLSSVGETISLEQTAHEDWKKHLDSLRRMMDVSAKDHSKRI